MKLTDGQAPSEVLGEKSPTAYLTGFASENRCGTARLQVKFAIGDPHAPAHSRILMARNECAVVTQVLYPISVSQRLNTPSDSILKAKADATAVDYGRVGD
jgi:hypothetical protein